MVFIKIKKTEEDYFVFETKTDILIDQVLHDLVDVYNKRIKLQLLVQEVDQLAQYGIMKNPEKQGLENEAEEEEEEEEEEEDTVDDDMVDESASQQVKKIKDPSGMREGLLPTKHIVDKIQETINGARALLSRERADRRSPTTDQELTEGIDLIRGAVMIAYPMGLPKWDTVELLLSNEFTHPEFHDAATATLWFAGRELRRGKKLMDNRSIGRNEKTLIVAKLQKKGSGPPVREAVVTKEEQKRLMAYWYKKQEEHKKLIEDEDDTHFNSEWANPKGLKNHFHGMGDVSWNLK